MSGPAISLNAGGEPGGQLLALLAHSAVDVDVVRGTDAIGMRERVEFQGGMPGVDDGADLLHDAFVGGEVAAVRVGVQQDIIAHLAAEQVVYRLAQHLAADVP